MNARALVLALLALALLPMGSTADDQDVIDYRKHIMATLDAQVAALGMIMAGAQRYRYRGAEHLAGSGTLDFGSGGQLTLSGGAGTFSGTFLGSGTLVLEAGSTLTLATINTNGIVRNIVTRAAGGADKQHIKS